MLAWIRENQLNGFVLGVLTGIFSLSLYQSFVLNGGNSAEWGSGFWQNFSTEMMGAFVTFILFELVIEARRRREEKQEAIEEKKKNLIIQLRSQDNATAIAAVEQLKVNNWIEDGSLQSAILYEANLQGTSMTLANLRGAYLSNVNLQDANLGHSNLEGTKLNNANLKRAELLVSNLQYADLEHTNLQRANLFSARLQNANLFKVDMEWAFLSEAKMQGANLANANLRNAELENTIFDEKTVLPDAEVKTTDNGFPLRDEHRNLVYDKYWTPQTDMSRYTDPNHVDENGNPDFWQPDWAKE